MRLSLDRARRFADRRARRPRTGSAAAAPGRPGARRLVTRGVAGAARRRHSHHRGSRGDARRLVTVALRPTGPPCSLGIHERHSRHAPQRTRSIPDCLARLAANRTSPASVHRRRRRGRGRGRCSVRPSWPHAGQTAAPRRAAVRRRHQPMTAPATGTLRISNWPLYMADGFVAAFQTASGIDRRLQGRLQRQRGVVRQDQGAAVAQAGHRRRPRRCRPVHGRPPASGLGWLNEITDTSVPEQEEPAARPARSQRSIPGRKFTAPYMSGIVGPRPTTGRPPAGTSPRSTISGIRRSRARSACSPTCRTVSA